MKMASGARNATFSVIGSDVAISGDIHATVDLHIDGRVEGDIVCAALVQGAESHIKGHVQAVSARLAGHIEGAISVGDLVIEASARITGDVAYESISVASGSIVDGRFTHRRGAGAVVDQPTSATDLKLVGGESTASA